MNHPDRSSSKIFRGVPPLQTPRLLLRRLTPEDGADVFAYASDPLVAENVTWYPHCTREESVAFIRHHVDGYDRGESGTWGMVLKEPSKLIGTCGFVSLNPTHCSAELAYALARTHWGRGLMTEAVLRLIDFGFQELGLNRIEAHHLPENPRSGRVLQKAGMRYEGTLRQKAMVKSRFRDAVLYAILKEDWRKTGDHR